MFWGGGFFRKSSCAAGGRAGRGGRDAGIHAGNGVAACRGDGGFSRVASKAKLCDPIARFAKL